MSRSAICYDNTRVESFWAMLNTEVIGAHVFAPHNRRGLHSAPGFQLPVD